MTTETILPLGMAIRDRLGSTRLVTLDAAFLHGDIAMFRRGGNHGIPVFRRRQQRHTHHDRHGKQHKQPIYFSQFHVDVAF